MKSGLSTSARVSRYRASLRRAGLRPVQIWVPDVRRPGFKEECQRQSRLLLSDPQEAEMLHWLDAAADRSGWE